jgi:hypothetical protein
MCSSMEPCRIDVYKVFKVSKINYNNTVMIAFKYFWKVLQM